MDKINLILPNDLVKIPEGARVYFLAGPIRGGGDWQKQMIETLAIIDLGCYIVCPRRYKDNHPMAKHRLATNDDSFSFSRQTLWERYYMNITARRGCLIFWLPVEDAQNPRPKDQGPYAQDTYGELGMWRTLASLDKSIKLVIGAEECFPGLSVLKANLDADFGYSFPICEMLDETARNAVNM